MPIRENKEDIAGAVSTYRFLVDWGVALQFTFQDVAGLEPETQAIPPGTHSYASAQDKPGAIRDGSVVMKVGLASNDNTFWNWYNEIKMNTIKPQTVIIKLLKETGAAPATWILTNASPIKMGDVNLNPDNNEISIDFIEVAYEAMIIS